jgi:hypothetical protein
LYIIRIYKLITCAAEPGIRPGLCLLSSFLSLPGNKMLTNQILAFSLQHAPNFHKHSLLT